MQTVTSDVIGHSWMVERRLLADFFIITMSAGEKNKRVYDYFIFPNGI